MKKKLFYFFLVITLIILIIILYLKNNKKIIKLKENNEFLINSVQYYSTANAASNTTNYQNPEWNLKVYQFTDIAIYIDRLGKNIDEKNYITNLEILNFKTNSEEEIYYLNPKMFGKNTLDLDTKVEDYLEYNVINSENKDNEQEYDIPIFFQDCSNPITFRYVRYLADNYKVPNDETLKYNGSLISKLGLKIDDLNKNLSFDLKIVTKDGKERMKNIDLKIPYENDDRNILDGDFESKINFNIRILEK